MATIQEAADYLNVSVEYVDWLIDCGRINAWDEQVTDAELARYKQVMIRQSSEAIDELIKISHDMDC
jgi:orotate phosphoribosyltransferase-like protein